MLNLPNIAALHDCQNLLIAGIGGGYDLFCGLPIYFELRERGQSVHLANLSFSQVRWLKNGIELAEGLVGVTAASRLKIIQLMCHVSVGGEKWLGELEIAFEPYIPR